MQNLALNSMKNKIIAQSIAALFLFVFLLPLSSFSQILDNISIKAGINSSSFYNSDLGNVERATGVLAGLGLDYGLPITNFSFRGEFLYVQKGAKQNSSTISVDYLILAIQAKYQVPPIKSYLFAGPYYGAIINSKLKNNNGITNLNDDDNDLGISVGAGFEFYNPFFVEVRYDLGFKDVNLLNQSSTGENTSFGVVLGFSI